MTGRTREPIYDRIGTTYGTTRQEDPRIAAQIHAALGDGSTVLNVGAGSGNYEPRDRTVVAVEPSTTMIAQRSGRSPLVVRGVAAALPFPDRSFDAAMCVLTLHHWPDLDAGLRELRRVSGRQVILYFDDSVWDRFWMLDYFAHERANAPGRPEIARTLDVLDVQPVMVPHDCVDGFGAAYWRRPEAYADPAVQAGISSLAVKPEGELRHGSERLLEDLASGAWDRRYGHLREQESFDGGYRLAVCSTTMR